MAAMKTTSEEDARYGLKPLQDFPFVGLDESLRLNAEYEAQRREYRRLNPHREKTD